MRTNTHSDGCVSSDRDNEEENKNSAAATSRYFPLQSDDGL